MIQTAEETHTGLDDPRDVPAYTYADAARILDIPATTLRAWTRGQAYRTRARARWFDAVIQIPDPAESRLSYNNLVEAWALRALRTVHAVDLQDVRTALRVAAAEFEIPRLLIHEDMRASAGEVFLERYGSLISLGKGQQLAMRKILHDHLWRVEYDDTRLARAFYPLVLRGGAAPRRLIVIDPRTSFGRPIVERRGIRTAAIFSRIDAGESVEHVAEDYGLTIPEIEEALLFEAAA